MERIAITAFIFQTVELAFMLRDRRKSRISSEAIS